MAFYTFGYRYILHSNFDYIRNYIRKSFETDAEDLPIYDASDDFHIATRNEVIYSDPVVRIVIPIKSGHICLEICFLKYEISLPLIVSKEAFDIMVERINNDLRYKPPLLAKEGEEQCVFVVVGENKANPQLNFYDFLLGKPLPKLDNNFSG